ncbi:MAG: endonuclease III [Erysipelotrichaceae bacterium]|nr:endonuclease III [Erysipelotrichaceae bacterium]
MKPNEILDCLELMFPNAQCELCHKNAYELTIAVVLSAQTTDVSVNKVTPVLFEKYPTPFDLAKADCKDVEECIRTLGLYRNKAKNIIGLAKGLVEKYNGIVPDTREQLTALDGVGRKSANVILSVCFDVPALAVDTHVERVTKRLGLVKANATVLETEKTLMKKLPKYRWNRAHHLFIFFGRYHCKAQKPLCEECPFTSICKEK